TTDTINGGTINTGAITIADSDTLSLNGSTISTGSITGANLVGGATPSNVTFNGTGAVTVNGAVGTDIGTVTVTNSAGTDFKSTVNASTVAISNTNAGQTVLFEGNLTTNTLTVAGTANAYNVALDGSS